MGHVFTICIRIENENEAWFFPFCPREMFRFGGAVQCASLSLCHFCLTLVFFQRRVRVFGRQEEAQEEHRREETVAGRERADTGGVQSGGADRAKGNVDMRFNFRLRRTQREGRPRAS